MLHTAFVDDPFEVDEGSAYDSAEAADAAFWNDSPAALSVAARSSAATSSDPRASAERSGWDSRPLTSRGQASAPGRAAAVDVAETTAELQSRIRAMQGTRLDTRNLPTHPAIASLLPGGGLQEGGVYSVERSATLLMALLAGPSAAGSWCGVVGVPEFGVEAASGFGIDLERLVLVPHPGDQWLAVTAAIADVLTVVVTRPPKAASDGSVARLAARLRQRGSTLIVLGPWPQTDAMLSLSESSWSGIGEGFGHLAAREVTVTVSTRAGLRPQSARLRLPWDAGAAEPASVQPASMRPASVQPASVQPASVRPAPLVERVPLVELAETLPERLAG